MGTQNSKNNLDIFLKLKKNLPKYCESQKGFNFRKNNLHFANEIQLSQKNWRAAGKKNQIAGYELVKSAKKMQIVGYEFEKFEKTAENSCLRIRKISKKKVNESGLTNPKIPKF